MIKKPAKKLILSILLSAYIFLMGLNLALAQSGDVKSGNGAPLPASDSTSTTTFSTNNNQDNPITPDQLFNKFNYVNGTGESTTINTKAMQGSKIGAVAALPDASWQKTLAYLVKTLLNISGGLTMLAMTVGGIMMVIAGGKPDLLDKGKKIVIYSIAGLLIIAVSYALVVGVSEFQFFAPTPAAKDSGQSTTPPANDQSQGDVVNSGPNTSASK